MKNIKKKVGVSKLSFSVPKWMEPLITQRAKALDLSRSQYIRRLIKNDDNQAQVSHGNVVNIE
jgi:hypothetical protein